MKISSGSIPVIRPKNVIKKHDADEILSDEQIAFIQRVLEKSCMDKVCLSRSRIYEELKELMGIGSMEKHQFEKAITAAIKKGRIKGFKTKKGAYGGICRE